MSELFLNEFDSKAELYSRVTSKAATLIRELLSEYDINVHSVTSRTKSRGSLAKKLAKPGRVYRGLNEVTDICGIRITTYFEEDVDRVISVLEKEFKIDRANSVDKRIVVDPERFGYMSTHHVVRLKDVRSELHEYRWFDGIALEIQTRSILQHAWAEIEHDLGYKSKNEVPKHIRRRFSRLAGILELADMEFNGIREESIAHDQSVAERIQTEPNVLEVDRSSLIAFVNSSKIISDIDSFLIAKAGWKLTDDEAAVADYANDLFKLGIKTIGALEHSLVGNRKLIENFAERWLADDSDTLGSDIYRGVSLFYLIMMLMAKSSDKKAIENYFLTVDVEESEVSRYAKEVMETYSLSIEGD